MKIFLKLLLLAGFGLSVCSANDIKEFAGVLDTENDFRQLQTFLNKNDGEIVKLTLRICGTQQFNGFADYVEDCPKNHLCLGIKASDEQRGEIYEFNEADIEYHDWRTEPEGLEDKYCKESPAPLNTQISGYFLFKEIYSDRDTDYMMYDSISKKEIKLSQLNKQKAAQNDIKSENSKEKKDLSNENLSTTSKTTNLAQDAKLKAFVENLYNKNFSEYMFSYGENGVVYANAASDELLKALKQEFHEPVIMFDVRLAAGMGDENISNIEEARQSLSVNTKENEVIATFRQNGKNKEVRYIFDCKGDNCKIADIRQNNFSLFDLLIKEAANNMDFEANEPEAQNDIKSENSNACDPVKAVNDFCNSDNIKKLIINEIKKDISSDVNIEIVSSKASSKLLEMLETSEKDFGKSEITEEECQKAETNGICDVFVTLKGVENGKNVSKDRQLEAIIIDGKVDTIRDKY